MKILNFTSNENLKRALVIISRHYRDDEFLRRVREIQSFNHTEDDGYTVATKILLFDKDVQVKDWTPFLRSRSRANGKYSVKNNTYYVNRFRGQSVIDWVKTSYHEIFGHGIGYSHKGDRVNAYNLRTQPYLVSVMFSSYISELYGNEL